MTLTRSESQAFYDRFGARQDAQGFYEDAALADLVAHADFEHAHRVFELGCGTGRFAARLLADHLPASASYLGTDASPVMAGLARERLTPFATRAAVVRTDGSLHAPVPDASVDRFVATYVLDLLSDADIRAVFAEAQRVLVPEGTVCIVSLGEGTTAASRLVAALWRTVYRIRPTLVGGCRPIRLAPYLETQWRIVHHGVVTPFAVPSEIIIAAPVNRPPAADTD